MSEEHDEETGELRTSELTTSAPNPWGYNQPLSQCYVGDVPWANEPPPPPWQASRDPVIVTQSTNTVTPNHHYCPVCGKVKTYDAHGVFVDTSRIDWCTCERDAPVPVVPWIPITAHGSDVPLTEERIRQIVTESMTRMLSPEQGGIVSHTHRRVRQWDADGTEWRGVLYKVEKEGEK